MVATSAGDWVHCGRVFSATEIAELCATVAWLPGLARKELAATVCEHLGWTTLTGTAKISACLEFLERLQAAGLLVLPALRPSPPRRCAPPSASVAPVARTGGALRPVGARAGVPGSGSRRDPGGAVGCAGGALASAGFPGRLRLPAALLHHRWCDRRLGCVLLSGAARAVAVRDRLDRLDGSGPPREPGAGAQQQPLADLSARPGAASGQSCARATGAPRAGRLAGTLGFRAPVAGDLRRPATPCRHLLPCGRLAVARSRPADAGWPARAGPITARPARCGSKPLTSDACRHRLCAAPGSPRS
jgi:hypothetical protein